jgi:alkylhydroperoxidase family enzyme
LAKQKGATEDQVDAVRDPGRGPFTGREKLGFRATDRLHRSACEIDNEFYVLLKRAFSDPEIIELVATAAAWEFFTRFVDALRIPTTPLAVRVGNRRNKRRQAKGKGQK